MPYKGKSTVTRESKRNGVSMSQLRKGTGILWSREYTREYIVARVKMDDRRSHSDLHRM